MINAKFNVIQYRKEVKKNADFEFRMPTGLTESLQVDKTLAFWQQPCRTQSPTDGLG